MRSRLSTDLDNGELSEHGATILSRDFDRLRTIQEQLALTMEVMNQ